jgi:hypothetical protein
LKNPVKKNYISLAKLKAIIVICTSLGLTWASLPLFGWSHYVLETTRITCSIQWNDTSLNVLSYNLTIFFSVFLLPFSFIIVFNIKMVFMMKKLRTFYQSTTLNKLIKKRIRTEKRITLVMVILIGKM